MAVGTEDVGTEDVGAEVVGTVAVLFRADVVTLVAKTVPFSRRVVTR